MRVTEAFDRLSKLSELDAEFLRMIRSWIETAPEAEIFRVNLVSWSRDREVPLSKAIGHFLHLAKAGILDLSWDAHCPFCNAVVAREKALHAVEAEHACRFCLESVASRLDDHFEVTFTPNAAIREISGKVAYEPSRNVEILSSGPIPANSETSIRLNIPSRVRRIRAVSSPPLLVRVVPAGEGDPSPHFLFLGGENIRFPESLPTGDIEPKLVNRTDSSIYLVLEDHEMREYSPGERAPRLTGLAVVTHPWFRTLFEDDTLSETESLTIRDVVVVFTDIRGSTELYRRIGDVKAYRLVRDHFEILFSEIQGAGGTIVKTIGDAVMGAFLRPGQAVHSLLAIQRRLRELRAQRAESGGISVRAGAHRGTALAVTLNGVLDFFGTSINEASRLESQCPANAVVLSDAILDDVESQKAIEGLPVEIIEAQLRGLPGTYRLHVVRPPD